MYYLDPLYGQLDIDDTQLRLFQTEALTRLRDVSLSAVPSLATPIGMITSRFEHSVGVAYLAKCLTENQDFKDLYPNLYLAGLLHDSGSPPFSHASEYFLSDLTGKNHEEFVVRVLEQPDLVEAIKAFGGEKDVILKLITGKLPPWSDLINGTIDLDNIDNSLRWSLGAGLLQNKLYEPEELIKAYCLTDGQLSLNLTYHSEIQKWELCRRLTYELVYSDVNLAPGMMLFRALQLAYDAGDLKEDFFLLTDSAALEFLGKSCNPATTTLISDMRHWHFYIVAGEIEEHTSPSETLKTFCLNWKERQKIADIIAESLCISREAVTVFAGKDKGFKKIHLPFIGEGLQEEHQPIQRLSWRMKVYLHPKYRHHRPAVQEILESIV